MGVIKVSVEGGGRKLYKSAARNLVLYTMHEGVVMEEEAPEDFTLRQIHTARRMMDNTNHKPSLWERIKERLGLRR